METRRTAYVLGTLIVAAALASESLAISQQKVAVAAPSSSWTIDSPSSDVTFLAVGSPGFLRIQGTGGKLIGTATESAQGVSGDFKVALENLKTGIGLRDRHMKEKYLKTIEFPNATLQVQDLPVNWTKEGERQPFAGTLTIKDVALPVQGTFVATRSANTASFQVEFAVKLNDFRVGVPEWLGVTVADTVEIKAQFQASAATAM